MRKLPWLVCVLCLSSIPVRGQDPMGSFDSAAPSPSAIRETGPERKRARFWIRPEKETPQAQLAHAQQLEKDGHAKAAAKHYNALVHRWHESTESVEAQYALAHLLETRGKPEKAFEAYQYMAEFYPGRFNHEDLLAKQLSLAEQIRTQRRLRFFFMRGVAAPERALSLYKKIVENAPEWEHADDAQYWIGRIHEGTESYDAAREAYQHLVNRYPNSARADEAGFRAGDCAYTLSRKEPRNTVLCRNALSALAGYLSGTPTSEENVATAKVYMVELKSRLAQAAYDRALFYDKGGYPEAALVEYRNVLKRYPAHALGDLARERIGSIEAEREQAEDE